MRLSATAETLKSNLSRLIADPMTQAVIILFLIFLSYSNSFSVPFHFDDSDYVVKSPMSHDIKFYTDPSAVADVKLSENVDRARHSRVVVLFSFWVNYALGGLDVSGYHALNLLIHMGSAMFLFGLLRVTIRSPFMRSEGGGVMAYLPLFGTLMFALHPANTIAVAYITQRFASMVALFMLGSLWAYASWRVEGGRGYYLISIAMAALAMKTKEPAFMLPVVMGLYEVMFFEGRIKNRAMALLPFVLVAGLVPLAHMTGGRDIVSAMTVNQEISRLDYIITEFRVLATYLRIFLLPVGLLVDRDYPIYRSVMEPAVLGSLALHLAIVGLALCVWFREGKTRAFRVGAFGALCFYITLVVESGLVPLADVIFEYRMYIPSAFVMPGIAAIMLSGISALSIPSARKAVVALTVALVMALALMTFSRNTAWQKESTIWAPVVEQYPDYVRARINLCNAYYAEDQPVDALPQCEHALKLDPYNSDALYTMALIYIYIGKPEEAIKSLEPVLVLRADNADTQYVAARAYYLKGDAQNAELYRQKAIALAPDRAGVFSLEPTAERKLAQ